MPSTVLGSYIFSIDGDFPLSSNPCKSVYFRNKPVHQIQPRGLRSFVQQLLPKVIQEASARSFCF